MTLPLTSLQCPLDRHKKMDNSLAAPSRLDAFKRALAIAPGRNLGVLALPGFGALSLWGPLEVLGNCSPAVVPTIVAIDPGVVPSAQGPRIHSDISLDHAPRFDLILIPDGNIGHAREDPHLLDWLDRTSSDAETVMAVGCGIDLLADAGHLDGRRTAENHSLFSSVPTTSPVDVVPDTCRVRDGRYVTCCNAGNAVDMALDVAAQLLGSNAAQQLGAHL